MIVSCVCFFFFKQKTAYEMRISDLSSDVCSTELTVERNVPAPGAWGVSPSDPLIAQAGASGNGIREATAAWRFQEVVGPDRRAPRPLHDHNPSPRQTSLEGRRGQPAPMPG